IEVWDTGVGIAAENLEAIFDEFHQVENPFQHGDRGLGLGLNIVERLGQLLNHPVSVRSQLGKGSVFTVDVALSREAEASHHGGPQALGQVQAADSPSTGEILLVEDDPFILELLKQILEQAGHRVASASDGMHGLDLLAN